MDVSVVYYGLRDLLSDETTPDPNHILRPPYKNARGIDQILQGKIAKYIGQVLGKRGSEVKHHLALPLFSAGKLRIRNGGDTFRTKQVAHRSGNTARRNCYVKVVFETCTGVITTVSYGDLEKIFVLTIPTDDFFAKLGGETIALALITPWDTAGKDATKENVYITSRKASIVTDVRSLKAVVGLVETRKRWGVIDRVLGAVAPSFAEGTGEEDESNDDTIQVV
ncbi:hypothetical protein PAXRUDRAFT_807196 [Paxillus rubicundulus Ve08.2h10]|uniref:Uncharacterized protein n=1 Tax=Paxillus rubicundulus Ve08.2h10 TaxID=930991 RepID=A0A0D0E7S4_9AGAM|nr:hypothetical protein PAXRUDRAFT_807196 [Paxillus rubicundulus Ve08.2h10]